MTLPKPPVDYIKELESLYSSIKVRPDWKARAEKAATIVSINRHVYKELEKITKVPWKLIGGLHLLEANCDFKKHLHNGDPLSKKTVNVPKGRPLVGNPPFSWIESAKDALEYDGLTKKSFKSMGEILDAAERYNGLGYRKRGLRSPYLWSGSMHYSQGKFVKDGIYDPRAVSAQVGIAVMFKTLEGLV